ncbi:MAG: hypothetical protein GXP45_06945 [bacterium]|nr:hypothetical protein [bacterium]
MIENVKVREKLEKQIQQKIKEMRSGKKVLDDASLEKADKDISTTDLIDTPQIDKDTKTNKSGTK